MKSAPVYRELGALDPSLGSDAPASGQHYDEARCPDVFFREARDAAPGRVPRRRLWDACPGQTAGARGRRRVLREREIDLCVVADVNSTLAGAPQR